MIIILINPHQNIPSSQFSNKEKDEDVNDNKCKIIHCFLDFQPSKKFSIQTLKMNLYIKMHILIYIFLYECFINCCLYNFELFIDHNKFLKIFSCF